MAGAPSGNQGDMITAINVTPLVDITLVLLIVFMVTATYIVKATIDVELPRAASGGENVGEMMTVVLKQKSDGDAKRGEACDVMALNGGITTEDALRAALRAAVAKDKDAKVLISADQACSHGEFVHLVDVVKQEGIAKFAINTEKTDAAPATAPGP